MASLWEGNRGLILLWTPLPSTEGELLRLGVPRSHLRMVHLLLSTLRLCLVGFGYSPHRHHKGSLEMRLETINSRKGQVVVLAAVAMVVMLLVCALAIDVGHVASTRARMQNGADAAAVAAALELAVQRNDAATESAARDAASAEALGIATANWSPCRTEVLFGTYADGQFVQQDLATEATAIQVTMIRDGAAPGGLLAMFFAPVMGIGAVEVHTPAVSQIATGIRTIRSGLGPFAVWEGDVVAPGQQMKIYWPDEIVPGWARGPICADWPPSAHKICTAGIVLLGHKLLRWQAPSAKKRLGEVAQEIGRV